MAITQLAPRTFFGKVLWYGVWAPINMVAAFVPLLLLNFMQFPSLLIRPFSKDLYRTYNRTIAFLVWGWWAWGIQHIVGVKAIITGDALPEKEDAIVSANHQGMADIVVIIILAMRYKTLGMCTWMAKDVLKYVPGLGWGMAFLDTIFLKRNWTDDKALIEQTFAHITREQVPLWLTMFPEGTRITAKKLAASQAYATAQKLPIPQHVLIPRPKGFIASVKGLRHHAKAIYSLTIGYEQGAPKLTALMRGEIPRVHMHVKRTPMSELPPDDTALGQWLKDDFQRRDALLSHFAQHGTLGT